MAETPASSPDDGEGPSAPPASLALIDAFVDSLWLEAGLAKLTLEAYRRDLRLLAEHLQARPTCWATSPRATPAAGPPAPTGG
jgi:hypothetical protein